MRRTLPYEKEYIMNLRRKAEELKTLLVGYEAQIKEIDENNNTPGQFNRKEFRKYAALRVTAAEVNEQLMDVQLKMEQRPRFLKALFKIV